MGFLTAIPAALRAGLLVAVALLVLGLAGWGVSQRWVATSARQQMAIAQADAAAQRAAVAERDSALAELQQQHARQVAALEGAAADARARAEAARPIERIINASPQNTTACVAHPGVRAVLDGLRRTAPASPAGGAGGTAGRAGGVADLRRAS